MRPWDHSEVADNFVAVFPRSLWSLGLFCLFLKTKKMRSTEAERMVYFIFIITISYTVLVLPF